MEIHKRWTGMRDADGMMLMGSCGWGDVDGVKWRETSDGRECRMCMGDVNGVIWMG